jgi:FlaA1/EpsC-like NDP-sugar epimerase
VKALRPEKLHSIILLDSSEHSLFEMQQYMEAMHPTAACQYILGSVEDRRLLDSTFRRSRPDIVFHAAAFKHVGLLEYNAFAAIQNNVLGTYTLVQAAVEHGVSKVLLLSTDKAVNPHSVMGVSKRIAEFITLSLSRVNCWASAIRLGNVIGSRGSVVPIFLEQITNGRSISITHPQASRYFLSKREAITAILAAGAAACDGMVLIPELGTPVLVADLAEFLVQTYRRSDRLPLRFIGLRPGEKLTEELLGQKETQTGSVVGGLTVVKTERLSLLQCGDVVRRLSAYIAQGDHPGLLEYLCQLVPEYVPSRLMRDSAALAHK